MAQLCLRIKQWLVLVASAFQSMRACFLCPKCDNFACLHTRQDQNELHLKRWFFFDKIVTFCKSIAGPLPKVVQAYTQLYSFGGRIKLIICQIRHGPSVTIHEISISWKNTLDGGPNSRQVGWSDSFNTKASLTTSTLCCVFFNFLLKPNNGNTLDFYLNFTL